MSLHARLRRLEKIEWSRPPAPCPSCGAPTGYVCGFVVQDPEGRSMNNETCPACGIETTDGRASHPIRPGGYREILVLPRVSLPLHA